MGTTAEKCERCDSRKKQKNEVEKVVQMELSDKSRKFIDDLRLYLFSSGKNDQEIREIAEELEDHLMKQNAMVNPLNRL